MVNVVKTGGFGVAVEGLHELRQALRTADRKLLNEVRKLHREMAKEGRVRARSKAQFGTGRNRFAKLIGSQGSERAATITYRGDGHPAAMGWLFGSMAFRQFRPWVGNRHTGIRMEDIGSSYAITPAIKELEPEWERTYPQRMAEAINRGLATSR